MRRLNVVKLFQAHKTRAFRIQRMRTGLICTIFNCLYDGFLFVCDRSQINITEVSTGCRQCPFDNRVWNTVILLT